MVRTSDLQVNSLALYLLSYEGRREFFNKNIKSNKQRNNDNTYTILKKLVNQISTLTRPNRPPYSNGYNNNNNRRSNLRRNNSQLRGNHNVKYNNPYNGRRQMNNNNNRNFIRASRY